MFKRIFILMLMAVALLYSQELPVFPSLGNMGKIGNTDGFTTIDGILLYDNKNIKIIKRLKSNFLLLNKITKISLKNNVLTKEELDDIERFHKEFDNLINKIDITQKIVELINNANFIDAKGLAYSIYDLVIKPNLQKTQFYKNNSGKFEIFENTIKLSLEYVIEKNKYINSSLIMGQINDKVLKNILVKFADVTGKVFAYWTGVVNTLKLSNNLAALKEVGKVQKQQIYDLSITSFLYDYILKYNSNLNKMYLKFVINDPKKMFYKNCKEDNFNFWTVWFAYNNKINNNDEWFSNLKFSKLNIREKFNAALKTWLLMAEYDSHFLQDAQFVIKKEVSLIDNKKIITTKQNLYSKNNKFDKLYLMPSIVDNFDNLEKGCMENNLSEIIYFKGGYNDGFNEEKKQVDNSNKILKVVKIDNLQIVYKTVTNKGKNREVDISFAPFYIKSFLTDIPKNYWAMRQIGNLYNKSIMTGFPDGTFRPENNVTIGEFLAVFTGAMYGKNEQNIASRYNKYKFPKNYAAYLHEVKHLNIDYNSSKNKLNSPATRGYVAKVIALTLNPNLENNQTIYNNRKELLYGDWDKYSLFIHDKGIVSGKLNECNYYSYSPEDKITRDELAVYIDNLIKVNKGIKLKSNINKNYPYPIKKFKYVLDGVYSTKYLGRSNNIKKHLGIDFMADKDTNVISVCNGKVINNFTERDVYNSFLIIEHNCSGKIFYGYYGHISSKLKKNDNVRQGQIIGKVKKWGNNSHLHFGINDNYKSHHWGVEQNKTLKEIKADGWWTTAQINEFFNYYIKPSRGGCSK